MVLFYNSFVWLYITAVSSVLLVVLLFFAAFFPLRVAITTEDIPDRATKPKINRQKAKKHHDDELFYDDEEL